MKRTRIISAALSFIIFAQFFLLSLSADGFDNVDKIDGVSHSLSVDKASDGVTEEDLIEAYDTFVEYTEENYFPGIMGLESFISEYYCLDCNGIDEYLELLYNTIESAIEAELSIIGGDEVSDLFEIDDSDDSQEYQMRIIARDLDTAMKYWMRMKKRWHCLRLRIYL